jgi:uncharacterized Ntn-hydrolase superfamily protein
MTFTLAARCRDSGMFGVATASSSPAVAARCAHVAPGVGAVASQNVTDPALGPLLLERLAAGMTADAALRSLSGTAHLEWRQLLVVDRLGRTAAHSGARTLGIHAVMAGTDAVAGGNLLAARTVPAAMIAAFESSSGHLGDRLIAALSAGRESGGEAGRIHSAGLQIADRLTWPCADLRIDWTEGDPVAELTGLWTRWKPQMADYVTRAEDPDHAPGFGAKGEG